MDETLCETITRERLAEWRPLLAASCCTPAVLVGIGHGPLHSGEVHICVPDGLPTDYVVSLLKKVIRKLETTDHAHG
jgi:hypothetical protein